MPGALKRVKAAGVRRTCQDIAYVVEVGLGVCHDPQMYFFVVDQAVDGDEIIIQQITGDNRGGSLRWVSPRER